MFYIHYPSSSGGSGSNPSVGTNGATAPTSSTEIGIIDPTGKLQGVSSTNPIPTKAPVNTNGSNTDSTVSAAATISAPANAVGFILMSLDTSSANIRWKIGSAASASSGQQLQPGRDTGYVPCAANISICAETGTQNYNVQWVLSS